MAKSTTEIIHDAFILGWQIVELKSRIQLSRLDVNDFTIQTASVWRSIVNKITALQIKAFPDSSTENTLYDPPGIDGLPYLYPPAPDYGNIGIAGSDNTGTLILENFKLYEVTRRAINCLTLLYMREEESLIPDRIKINKDHLISAIFKAATDTGGGGGEVLSADNTPQIKDGGEEANSPEGTPLPATELDTAISILTERTVKFLEAWDGYLRENYYAGGLMPNDESELVAYEAGHSMSLLSWGISLSTVPLEAPAKDEIPDLKTKIEDAWKTVFRDQAVIRLQHQISSLSTVLDEDYYSRNPTIKRLEENAVLQAPNPDLPSQSISAVKHSIDYWQRTIKWITEQPDEKKFRNQAATKSTDWSAQMRLALIEQANIWQTLMTGQQSLRAFNLESITHKLMEDITKGVQDNLRTNFKGSLHDAEKAMKDIAGEVKEAVADAGKAAIAGIEDMYQTYKRYLWPILAIIGAVILVLIFVAVMVPGTVWTAGAGGVGFTGVLTALAGYFGLDKFKTVKNTQKSSIETRAEVANAKIDVKTAEAQSDANTGSGGNLFNKIEGAGQQAGKMVMDAISNGYQQIQIELTGLSRSAAVAYPLIEFFTLTFTIEGDEDFLTSVIWSGKERADELKRVLAAAFGPLALFIPPAGE